MDLLFFVNKALLKERIDARIADEAFESLWHERLCSVALRALQAQGVTNRVPFVMRDDWRIDEETSELFLLLSGQVLGRTSMESYARHIFRFLQTLIQEGGSVETVTKKQMANYKRRRLAGGIEDASWNTEASVLKSFFNVVVELEQLRTDNPCDQTNWTIRGASVAAKEPDFITLADFKKFRDEGLAFGNYGLRNVAFADMLLTSGMRLNEGNSFKATELWTTKYINAAPGRSVKYTVSAEVAKGAKERPVKITKSAIDSMRLYDQTVRPGLIQKGKSSGLYTKGPDEFWLNQSGRPMGRIGWEDIFRRASNRSGVKATPKTLRHTCAVYLLSRFLKILLAKRFELDELREQASELRKQAPEYITLSIFGDPLRKVQKYLGHARYETTFIYLDVLGSHHEVNDEALAVFDEVISAEEAYDLAF